MFRPSKTRLSSISFSTDRSKAVLLLQYFFIGVSVVSFGPPADKKTF